mmetsp:Transcript_11282/g.28177  ORF Transcript_11282/g.28177 Transcript_11282/m.28177 type:complete len:100 (+) Transcript_11282:1290-1589(+)
MAARARGATRQASGGASVRRQLAEAQEKIRSMARALHHAREIGQQVAGALTDAKARDLHPKICDRPLPVEPAARIRDIANAIVSLEAFEQAQGVVGEGI